MQSTPEAPVFLIPEAIHCNDLSVKNAEVNQGIRTAQTEMIRLVKKWVADFPQKEGHPVRQKSEGTVQPVTYR